uniref:Ig-like domain-containing protein n=1 Tax=Astyanax mexicanus TaxID=7994 RepID=A0A3B1JK25_ASTMX
MKLLIIIHVFIFSLSVETVLGLTLEQPELSWTKPEGKTLYIDCKVTDLGSGNNVHWYQQKDGEALRRILYINNGGTTKTLDPNHPEKDDFTMSEGTYKLKVKAVKKIHAAVYYCACWDGEVKVFGSGTRLYVTDKKIKPPELAAFPISPSEGNGKRALLCQARGMYPDLVKFMWKDQAGNEVKLSDTEELLEQRDEGQEVRVTSMLIIDQQKARSNTFTCSVQHEDKVDNIKIPADKAVDASDYGPVPSCPPPKQEEEEKYGSFELIRQLNLFNLTYVSLLVKNVLYFGGLCFLLYKRRDRTITGSPTPNQGK